MAEGEDLTIPQMRDHIKELETSLKKAQDSMKGLSSENRLLKAREAFREAGYQPQHAELFVGANPEGELSEEAVIEFVQRHQLAPAGGTSDSGEGTGDSSDEGRADSSDSGSDSGLANMGGGGTRAGDGGAAGARTDNTMTIQDWRKLHATDPAAARKAVNDGRVRIREDNPYA